MTWKRITAIVVGLLVVGLIGWSVFFAGRRNTAVTVTTAKAARQNITATVATTGTIIPTQQANLSGSGVVTAVNVQVGDTVNQGQVLATYNRTTNLTATQAGTVTAVNIQAGQTDNSAAAGKAAITIANLSDLRVQLSLTKSESAQVKKGQSAKLTYLNQTDTGQVASVAPTATTTTSATGASTPTRAAQVTFTKQPTNLVPGFDIDVTITVDSAKNALTIPQEAITYDRNNHPLVFRVVKGKARQTSITTGLQSNTRIAVSEGLAAGDVIILSPSTSLKNGSAVTAK